MGRGNFTMFWFYLIVLFIKNIYKNKNDGEVWTKHFSATRQNLRKIYLISVYKIRIQLLNLFSFKLLSILTWNEKQFCKLLKRRNGPIFDTMRIRWNVNTFCTYIVQTINSFNGHQIVLNSLITTKQITLNQQQCK